MVSLDHRVAQDRRAKWVRQGHKEFRVHQVQVVLKDQQVAQDLKEQQASLDNKEQRAILDRLVPQVRPVSLAAPDLQDLRDPLVTQA